MQIPVVAGLFPLEGNTLCSIGSELYTGVGGFAACSVLSRKPHISK